MTKDDKNKTAKTNNIALAIAMGAGIGIIFGEFIFNNIGIAFSSVKRVK